MGWPLPGRRCPGGRAAANSPAPRGDESAKGVSLALLLPSARLQRASKMKRDGAPHHYAGIAPSQPEWTTPTHVINIFNS